MMATLSNCHQKGAVACFTAVPALKGFGMTIARVLMAACIMVLGFMLWGIHNGLNGLTTEAKGIRADITSQISDMKGNLMSKAMPQPERTMVPLPPPRPPACVCQRTKKASAVHHRRQRAGPPPVSIVTPEQLNEIDRLMAHRRHAPRGPPPPQHNN